MRPRLLHPKIWSDAKLLPFTAEELCIWIAVICSTDDEGIFERSPESIQSTMGQGRTLSSCVISTLSKLETLDIVVPYGGYAFIPRWFSYQRYRWPKKTVHRRPPDTVVKQYPEYICEWQRSFKEHYPFEE